MSGRGILKAYQKFYIPLLLSQIKLAKQLLATDNFDIAYLGMTEKTEGILKSYTIDILADESDARKFAESLGITIPSKTVKINYVEPEHHKTRQLNLFEDNYTL